MRFLGIDKIIKHQLHFWTERMVNASRAHGFIPSRGFPQACTRTALSRPFGHRYSPVQASNMCTSKARPVSRVKLAVICGARSALRRWSCSNCEQERRCERIHCVRKCNCRFNIHVQGKRPLYFRHFKLDETAETDVSDQRGRRKTAELHISGAKRAETRREGVKW